MLCVKIEFIKFHIIKFGILKRIKFWRRLYTKCNFKETLSTYTYVVIKRDYKYLTKQILHIFIYINLQINKF